MIPLDDWSTYPFPHRNLLQKQGFNKALLYKGNQRSTSPSPGGGVGWPVMIPFVDEAPTCDFCDFRRATSSFCSVDASGSAKHKGW